MLTTAFNSLDCIPKLLRGYSVLRGRCLLKSDILYHKFYMNIIRVFCLQRTRAEVLLERACVRRQGTSDVLENARLWNVPVWPLAKLAKWLTVLKESGRYKPSKTNGVVASKSSSLSSSPKVTRLRAPFIKTEAFTRLVAFLLKL